MVRSSSDYNRYIISILQHSILPQLWQCYFLIDFYISLNYRPAYNPKCFSFNQGDRCRLLTSRIDCHILVYALGQTSLTLPIATIFQTIHLYSIFFNLFGSSMRTLHSAYASKTIKQNNRYGQQFFSLRTDFNPQLYFHGISVGYLCDFMTSHVAYKEISIDDIEKIKQWTGSTVVGSTDHCIPRNLIFIIVESLNTKAIEWEYNGRMAMPFLNSLIADSASITFTSMYPQAGLGRSSDGQMMYLTGIYPSKGTPMSIIAPYGPYPSLARLFPKNADTFEIIYESAGL